MASKLDIFNNALHLLGERRLSTLYEDREPRYVLDNIYSLEVKNYLLELVQPRFAISSAKLSSPSTSSVHGLDNVYALPGDYLCPIRDPGTHGKVGSFFADDEFTQPINRYILEGTSIATEIATNIYIRYVSNGAGEGNFTPLFARLVAHYLAREAAPRLNPSKLETLEKSYEEALEKCIYSEGLKENDFIPQEASGALSADQLLIYNVAMAHLGLPELRGVSDDSQYRAAIDAVYTQAEDYLFESIRPRFATQTAILSSPSTSSVHGLDEVFSLPADYRDFVDLWADEDLEHQITQYIIEDNTIAIQNYATAYLRYITNAHAEANWSPSFKQAMSSYIAWLLCPRFAPERREEIKSTLTESVATAVENDKVREREVRTQAISGSLSAAQLLVYNLVANHVGEPELRFVDDESELRLAIEKIYSQCRDAVFEAVKPRFATQTAELASPSASSVHGLDNVFSLPADYLDFVDLWADDKLENQIHQYIIEDNTIATQNYATAYLRYITNAHAEANWSPSVTHAVAAYIAWMLAPRFKPDRTADFYEVMSRTLELAREADGARERMPRTQDVSGSLSAEQLALYNQVAARLAVPEIRFVDDESELRLAIDNVYGSARDYVIEQVAPLFATKTAELTTPAASSVHAFDNVFTLPSDYSGLMNVWTDDTLDEEVHRYFIEAGTIAVENHSTIYIRYSANAAAESVWTPAYKEALADYIAWLLAPRFSAEAIPALRKNFEISLARAIQIDRGREPQPRPLPGTRVLSDAYRELYNKVMEILRLKPIISNDDESERKVAVDYALDMKAVDTVFELIPWDYPVVTTELTEDGVYDPSYGYQFRFAVPADWIRTESISANDRFLYPLERYHMEGSYFFADINKIYLRYVSSDHLITLSTWPTYIFNLVAAEIARRICHQVGEVDQEYVERKYQEYKTEAFNTDAQRQPPQLISGGSWTSDRWYGIRDRRRP